MNTRLNSKLLSLEDTRLALIERLKAQSLSVLETPPAPGKWSVAQIFYHLNRAEALSVLYVNKKRLDTVHLVKTGVKEKITMMIAKIRMALPFALKAPVNVLGDVPEKVSYTAIIAEWTETRRKLEDLLDSLPDEMLYKNVFKQPDIGRVNIFQMLEFMQAHFNRHQKQVERIIVKKPA